MWECRVVFWNCFAFPHFDFEENLKNKEKLVVVYFFISHIIISVVKPTALAVGVSRVVIIVKSKWISVPTPMLSI